MKLRSFAPCLFASLGLALLSGCGGGEDNTPPLFAVRGTVTLDGQPLPTGEVLFVPVDGHGRPDAGKIADGKYELRCTQGAKTVSITSTKEVPAKQPGGIPDYISVIPKQYNSATKLTADVKGSGENTVDFKLESK